MDKESLWMKQRLVAEIIDDSDSDNSVNYGSETKNEITEDENGLKITY